MFAIKSLNASGGGAERVLVEVCNGLAARGHDIAVLTFDPPGGMAFYPLDPGIGRTDLDIADPGESTRRLALLRSAPRIRCLVAGAAPEVVVAFMHSTYVPVLAALLGSGIPVVASEHAPAAHYRGRPVQRMLVAIGDRLAAAKTVPSALVQDAHSRQLCRLHTIPNPVDVAAFDAARDARPTSPPILLCVGVLRPEKNQIDLIRAFARVAPRFPDWRLRIVGDGSERASLEAETARLGMQDRITMPGSTRAVAAEYAAASVVAVPSLYEIFGLVAAEAMASGRPVISFDRCLGIADMIDNGRTGLLVRGSDSGDERVASLSEGLERLMSDPELRRRLGEAAPDSIRRFGLDGVLDVWEALLCSVAGAPATRAPDGAGN